MVPVQVPDEARLPRVATYAPLACAPLPRSPASGSVDERMMPNLPAILELLPATRFGSAFPGLLPACHCPGPGVLSPDLPKPIMDASTKESAIAAVARAAMVALALPNHAEYSCGIVSEMRTVTQ